MRGLRFGLAIAVSTACIAAVTATSASASARRTISISANTTSPERGSPVTISGMVSPNAHGQTIELQQRRANTPWATVNTAKLGTASRYRFRRYLHGMGVFLLRTKMASVVSRVETMTVYQTHFLANLPTTATSGGCITTGPASARGHTDAHTVSMDLTCGNDVWAEWNLAKGCRTFHSILFFTDASSSDAKATFSITTDGTVRDSLALAESDFSAPGLGEYLVGVQTLRLEANAPSGTTPIAAYGDPTVDCSW
jgi:hypothetical protein